MVRNLLVHPSKVFTYANCTGNMERYRKSYFCPVPGCRSTRALKKLSNHLTAVHNMRDSKTRLRTLQQAKEGGAAPKKTRRVTITIKEAFTRSQRQRPPSSTILQPQVAPKPGSTRHYKRFDLDEDEKVKAFLSYLTSFDGGNRRLREARQVAQDISKYLAFVDSHQLEWSHLNDPEKILRYVERMERDGIGADGLTTKLDRLLSGLKYAILYAGVDRESAKQTQERVKTWKDSFRRRKPSIALRRMLQDDASGDQEAMTNVVAFLDNQELRVH